LGIDRFGCKKNPENTFPGPPSDMLTEPMRETPERTVFTVMRDGDAWAVELQGAFFGHNSDKEVVKAAAHKRAREWVDRGAAVQVRVQGEGVYR
jgi:hypothetical protein